MTAPVLVDSNVLLDLLIEDEAWLPWSAATVADVGNRATLVVNPIIFAEISVHVATVEALDEAFPEHLFRREHLPWDAAFLAGKAFLAYRRAGGPRRSPLPDFFIGAHATVAGYRLLTRDGARYRSYFPRLELIAP
jgi:hypothetical protein